MALTVVVASGVIAWIPALVTLVAAVFGGVPGGRLARWIRQRWLDGTVIGLASLLTVAYGY